MVQCMVHLHRIQLHDRVAIAVRFRHTLCELHHLHRSCPMRVHRTKCPQGKGSQCSMFERPGGKV